MGRAASFGLEALLSPRSVAVVGASADLDKFNGRVVRNLLRHGFKGRVYPVNPKYDQVAGTRCWPRVAALPETPDTAFIAVGRERVPDVVRECAGLGVRSAIVYTGGFAEADEAGARLEEEIREVAQGAGMRVCGPNTAGVQNFHKSFHMAGLIALDVGEMLPGRIGVVCQSGSIGGALLSRATERGIGFSYLISCGNEMDLGVPDYLDYLIDDPGTDAIAVYLEGVRDGERFKKILAKALRAGKPLVVLKVGEASEGARAAQSHTGALVGEDRVYEAIFRQWGVARVDDLEALFEVAQMFCLSPRPQGRRVGIVTTTGGAGALMADRCGARGLDVACVDGALRGRMAEAFPGFRGAGNPLDTTIADIHLYPDFLEFFMASGAFDIVVPIVGSSAQFRPEMGVAPIARARKKNPRVPLLAYLNPHAEDAHRLLAGEGVPSFQSITGCARAAAALARCAEVIKRHEADEADEAPELPPLPDLPDLDGADALNEAQCLALLDDLGLPVVAHRFCGLEEAEEEVLRAAGGLRFPLVLKGVSAKIRHKTEWGIVKTGIMDAPGLARAMGEIKASPRAADLEGFLLAEQVADGAEFLLGARRDPQFGPVVTIGLGGTAVELLGDVSARAAPLSLADAHEMMGELRCREIFEGHRGRGPLDTEAFAATIRRLGEVAWAGRERFEEIDLNPVFVREKGGGCLIADALIIMG